MGGGGGDIFSKFLSPNSAWSYNTGEDVIKLHQNMFELSVKHSNIVCCVTQCVLKFSIVPFQLVSQDMDGGR